MYYAPQPWLADWSALTDEIVKANEEGEDNMATGEHKRKPIYVPCSNCGKEFLAFSKKAQYCPECKKIIHRQEQARYKANMRMSAADVPDVPADDYDTLEEKIRKTAPIETVLVPKKEDKEMDTERAERLKSFPSMSNRLEHPEYFTSVGDTPESLAQTTTVPADNDAKKTFADRTSENIDTMLEMEIKKDRKKALLDFYKTMTDIAKFADMTVTELISRMTSIDEALS